MANVLIIEDDELMREVLQSIVEMYDHTSIMASSGKEALNILEVSGASIEIIFMDWFLADMRGGSFLQAIHDDGRWVAIPTVLVTGSMLRDIFQALQKYNIQYLISKPFQLDEIEKVLQDLTA